MTKSAESGGDVDAFVRALCLEWPDLRSPDLEQQLAIVYKIIEGFSFGPMLLEAAQPLIASDAELAQGIQQIQSEASKTSWASTGAIWAERKGSLLNSIAIWAANSGIQSQVRQAVASGEEARSRLRGLMAGLRDAYEQWEKEMEAQRPICYDLIDALDGILNAASAKAKALGWDIRTSPLFAYEESKHKLEARVKGAAEKGAQELRASVEKAVHGESQALEELTGKAKEASLATALGVALMALSPRSRK